MKEFILVAILVLLVLIAPLLLALPRNTICCSFLVDLRAWILDTYASFIQITQGLVLCRKGGV